MVHDLCAPLRVMLPAAQQTPPPTLARSVSPRGDCSGAQSFHRLFSVPYAHVCDEIMFAYGSTILSGPRTCVCSSFPIAPRTLQPLALSLSRFCHYTLPHCTSQRHTSPATSFPMKPETSARRMSVQSYIPAPSFRSVPSACPIAR